MHGVVFEIEIKINTPALDFPLINIVLGGFPYVLLR